MSLPDLVRLPITSTSNKSFIGYDLGVYIMRMSLVPTSMRCLALCANQFSLLSCMKGLAGCHSASG